MSEILENLMYLGSRSDAENHDFLRQKSIRGIVCCLSSYETISEVHNGRSILSLPSDLNIEVLHVDIEDTSREQLLAHFPRVISFLLDKISCSQAVLFNCKAGISRSPALCIASLMALKNWSLSVAFRYVMNRRPNICPNIGFIHQLCAAETQGNLILQGLAEKHAQAPGLRTPTIDMDAYLGWYTSSTRCSADPLPFVCDDQQMSPISTSPTTAGRSLLRCTSGSTDGTVNLSKSIP